jgi:hypothetical protein
MQVTHLPTVLAMLMLAVAQSASAADDFKVIKLEQDVRRLEQQVRDLSRQVAELRRTAGTSIDQAAASREVAAPPSSTSPLWLQAKNWQRLKNGMSELQVIDILGPPTSTRAADADNRVLLYALEIGIGSFLSGSVELRDRRVVEIKSPVLK